MEKKQQKKQWPKHIGVIIDGNRRYARKKGMKSWRGHDYGYENFKKFLEWCKDFGIIETTIYTFSLENFKRPKNEVNRLMKLLEKALKEMLEDKRVDENQIHFNVIGRLHILPKKMRDLIKEIKKKTKKYKKFKLNLAIAYTGRAEIVDAVKKIAEKVKKNKLKIKNINQKTVLNNLYIQSEPDLIIRPGKEQRLSGFLLYQADYSELYFCKKMWPEFTKTDFKKALDDFAGRKRRLGG